MALLSFLFIPSSTARGSQVQERQIAHWLFSVVLLIWIMIILGGLTRLTGSGLSMVDWSWLGSWPPLEVCDWDRLLRQYQTSPEYRLLHPGMTLDAFKKIFWLEYIHRHWGRLIGLVFLVPLGLSLRSAALRKAHFLHLFGLWCLGGAQGFLGWIMVQSGLVDVPIVDVYRLVAHFSLACLTYALVLFYGMKLYGWSRLLPLGWMYYLSVGCLGMTLVYGAFVAGLKAGLLHNTFPLMDGQWIPDHLMFHHPFWRNFFENPTTVQFLHRCFAFATGTLMVGMIFKHRHQGILERFQKKSQGFGILLLVLGQGALGVVTLLYHVPLITASLHQANALILLTLVLIYPYSSSERRLYSLKRLSTPQSPAAQVLGEIPETLPQT